MRGKGGLIIGQKYVTGQTLMLQGEVENSSPEKP